MIQSVAMRGSIQRNTRVLFLDKRKHEYLMTNDTGSVRDSLRVFSADSNGRITMEGVTLGSLFSHNPSIVPDLQEMECSFEELNPDYFNQDPVVDGLLGQAVGDAFGVPVEFMRRAEVRKLDLQDMVGNDGPLEFSSRWSFLIPAGAWSDDTSMSIAAMSSIINHAGIIDYDDVMKEFLAWWDHGEYTSIHFPFGLGNNISHALDRYRRGTPATECGGKGLMDNGNGALMRIFPFSMYCIEKELSQSEALSVIQNAAGLTHAHEINVMSCFVYTLVLDECIRTRNAILAYQNAVLRDASFFNRVFSNNTVMAHDVLFQLAEESFDPDSIPQSGYVVDSLAIALYSLLRTNRFEDAIKMAIHFGYDTDTNAAITGSIAGAMYGQSQIPQRWLNKLRKKELLLKIGQQFSKSIAISSKDS